MKGLAIRDVAERTGLAAGTIRMWEQRYGAPVPGRSESGYRVYSPDDVEMLRRAVAFRERGLSVPAALERAQSIGETDRPSIYGAIVSSGEAPATPRVLRKRTLIQISRAIEDETMARAASPGGVRRLPAGPPLPRRPAPLPPDGRERERDRRLRRLRAAARRLRGARRGADLRGGRARQRVGGDRRRAGLRRVPPGLGAAALARGGGRPDFDRRFESLWTMDPAVVRRAAQVGSSLTRASCPQLADEIDALLADRPLAMEAPAPGLTALTNRLVSYLEG